GGPASGTRRIQAPLAVGLTVVSAGTAGVAALGVGLATSTTGDGVGMATASGVFDLAELGAAVAGTPPGPPERPTYGRPTRTSAPTRTANATKPAEVDTRPGKTFLSLPLTRCLSPPPVSAEGLLDHCYQRTRSPKRSWYRGCSGPISQQRAA